MNLLLEKMMIGYVTLGTNDLDRAGAFYDQLLGEIGAGRGMQGERFIAWAASPDRPMLGVIKPFNGAAAAPGNGGMTAFVMDNKAKVDALYNKAIALGGTCEGPPGARTDGFYASYCRDLDGNKLCFYYMGA